MTKDLPGDRQTFRQADKKQTERPQSNQQIRTQANKQTSTQTNRQTPRHKTVTNRQTLRQSKRQTEILIDYTPWDMPKFDSETKYLHYFEVPIMGQKSKKNLYFCMVLSVTDFLHYLIKYFELPTKGQKIKKKYVYTIQFCINIIAYIIRIN